MIHLEFSRPHKLLYPEARKRAEAIAIQFGEKYSLTWRWDASTIRFSGHGIEGFILVAKDQIRISLELPPLLFGLQGVISTGIKEHLAAFVAEPTQN